MSECVPLQIARPDFWPKVAIGAQSAATIGADGQLRMSGSLLPSDNPEYSGWEIIQPGQQWRMVVAEAYELRYAAIRADGTLWEWGDSIVPWLGNYPVQNGVDSDWVLIHISDTYRSLAIKTDGTLWAWGTGYGGQLGMGNRLQYNNPTRVGSETDWAWVGGIDSVTYAKKKDGTLWACGWNRSGRVDGNALAADVLTLTLVG